MPMTGVAGAKQQAIEEWRRDSGGRPWVVRLQRALSLPRNPTVDESGVTTRILAPRQSV